MTVTDPGPGTSTAPATITLLDVGSAAYGDAIFCRFGDATVLIDGAHPGNIRADGAHPSLPQQLAQLLGPARPARVSLLIVTHAHADHIGCLPDLVAHDLLRADWALVADPNLGWGRPVGGGQNAPDAFAQVNEAVRPRLQEVLAALREDPLPADASADDVNTLMMDAAGLDTRYAQMLETLAQRGTHIVPYRGPNADLQTLLTAFASVGLAVLGPSEQQLLVCTDKIAQGTSSGGEDAARAVAATDADAPLDTAQLYRRLQQALVDGTDAATDAAGRLGAAVNCQSLVVRFAYGGGTYLFTGDMQFDNPEIPELHDSMAQLREAVQADGPYRFVKVAHHGSWNAFTTNELGELGATPFFGICSGTKSPEHPGKETLEALRNRAQTAQIQWARTDHNGLSTFTDGPRAGFAISSGDLNDLSPSGGGDAAPAAVSAPHATPAASATPPTPTAPTVPATSAAPAVLPRVSYPIPSAPTVPVAPPQPLVGELVTRETMRNEVEVVARVPHVATRVTLTIDVAPGAASAMPGAPVMVEPISHDETSAAPSFRLAGGRTLPRLLFVTSTQAFAANIGVTEAGIALGAITDAGQPLYADVPAGTATAAQAATAVRAALQRDRTIAGVVLLGGYDVLPSQRIDVLSPALRQQLAGTQDPDNFIVWSDAVYGDIDGDGLSEIPVSRIPDGKSPALVFAALGAAGKPTAAVRGGVRNVHRPFADGIYQQLPGAEPLMFSEPVAYNQTPAPNLMADRIYLMLHGDWSDSSRFWGERASGDMLVAVDISNVPTSPGAVVFTGCCWGALMVDTPAAQVTAGRPIAARTPDRSIALRFLAGGAIAFIGCTGAHYSPCEPPYAYYGGPMHDMFWKQYIQGVAPAQALFNAKTAYITSIPHQQPRVVDEAIERKVVREYTCLGLGW